jgi:PKD repeat protein
VVLPPVNLGAPVISGTPTDRQTLTTSYGSWLTGPTSPTSYAYQWQDCDTSGNNCANISGATSNSYVLQTTDIGRTIRSVVTASNSAGSAAATSGQTPAVSPPAAPMAAFTFSPSSPGTGGSVSFDGTGSSCIATPCSFLWADDPPSGTSTSLGTGQTLAYAFPTAGTKYVTLTVTDALGRSASAEHNVTVTTAAPTNSSLPTIIGPAQQAQTLTASNGSWTGSPTSYGYQWEDCNSSGNSCTNISSATSSSYELVSGDVGHTIRVAVTATNPGGSASASSAQTAMVSTSSTAPVAVFMFSPTNAVVGQTVNFDGTGSSCSAIPCTYAWTHGAGTAMFGTAVTATYNYQTTGLKTPTLTVTDALGRTSTVEHDVTVSAGTPSPPSYTAAPQISGTAQQNSTLTTSNGSWTGSPTSYTYQWQDCGAGQCQNISGATSSSYTLQSSDVGATIDVVVTAANGGGSASATSAQTAAVTAGGGGGGGGGGSIPCALSAAANSCWSANTGVQGGTGYSEAQIEAGAPGFTHRSGDLLITTSGTTIDHYWISGCVGIEANNVTIKDSLITPNGDNCSGGINASGGSQASGINNGRNTTGTLITDTTVDGGNNPGQAYGVSIDAGTVTRSNSFGFVDNFWTSGCAAQGCTTTFIWSGDYSHDPAGKPYNGGGHEQLFMFYGATYLTLTDSYGYFNTNGDGAPTGVLNWQPGGSGTQYASQGPVAHVDVDHSFLDANGNGVDIIDGCGVGGNELVEDNVLDSSSGVSYWRTSGTGPHGTAGPGNVWSGNSNLSGAAYPDPGSTNC